MRIISGAQDGVDIAALRAARACGIETGGWMPIGFRSHSGRHPEYAALYGLKAVGISYSVRTYRNVKESDATLRIARTFRSPGEICTMNAIRQYGKRSMDVDVDRLSSNMALRVIEWIGVEDIHALNVSGNSEQTCPGIGAQAYSFLFKVFTRLVQEVRFGY